MGIVDKSIAVMERQRLKPLRSPVPRISIFLSAGVLILAFLDSLEIAWLALAIACSIPFFDQGKRFFQLSMASWVAIVFGMLFLMPGLSYLIYTYSAADNVLPDWVARMSPEEVSIAMRWLAVAFIFYWIGCRAVGGAHVFSLYQLISPITGLNQYWLRWWKLALALMFIFIFSLLFGFFISFSAGVSNLFMRSGFLGFIILVIGFSTKLVSGKVKTKWYFALFILGGVLIITGMLSGFKGAMLEPIAIIALVYLLLGRIRRTLLVVLLMVSLIPSLFTFVDKYRILNWYEEVGRLEALNEAATSMKSRTGTEMIVLQAGNFVARINRLTEYVVVTSFYDTYNMRMHGLTFYWTIMNLIPRVIWPGKPNISGMINDISLESGYSNADPNRSSAKIGLTTELWINYGPYGLLPGMFFFGLLTGLIWRWLLKGSVDIVGAVFSIVAVLWPMLQLGNLNELIAWILFLVVPVSLLVRLWSIRVRVIKEQIPAVNVYKMRNEIYRRV